MNSVQSLACIGARRYYGRADDQFLEAAPVTTVYKICRRADWEAARAQGVYRGNADDARDGFIHLSAVDQVSGTLARHFAGWDDLVLVAIDSHALGDALRWEPSRGGDLFPHLYAPLPLSAVHSVESLPPAPPAPGDRRGGR